MISIQDFSDILISGVLPLKIIIYGSSEPRKIIIKEIIKHFIDTSTDLDKEAPLKIENEYSDISFNNLQDYVLTRGFFSDKKVFLIDNLESIKTLKKIKSTSILSLLAEDFENHLVLFTTCKEILINIDKDIVVVDCSEVSKFSPEFRKDLLVLYKSVFGFVPSNDVVEYLYNVYMDDFSAIFNIGYKLSLKISNMNVSNLTLDILKKEEKYFLGGIKDDIFYDLCKINKVIMLNWLSEKYNLYQDSTRSTFITLLSIFENLCVIRVTLDKDISQVAHQTYLSFNRINYIRSWIHTIRTTRLLKAKRDLCLFYKTYKESKYNSDLGEKLLSHFIHTLSI